METTLAKFDMRTIALHLIRSMSVRSSEKKKENFGTSGILRGKREMIRCFSSKGKLKL